MDCFVKILKTYQKSQDLISPPFYSVEVDSMIKLSKHVENVGGFDVGEKYTFINVIFKFFMFFSFHSNLSEKENFKWKPPADLNMLVDRKLKLSRKNQSYS